MRGRNFSKLLEWEKEEREVKLFIKVERERGEELHSYSGIYSYTTVSFFRYTRTDCAVSMSLLAVHSTITELREQQEDEE